MNIAYFLLPKHSVAYLYDDCTFRQGLEKMRHHGYTAIPVISRSGKYVGTVSEGDFLWSLLDQGDNSLRAQEKLPLGTLMRQGFNPAVSIRVSMSELMDRAMHQSFVPVVDDRGAFMGIVTRQTIMRKLVIPAVEKGRQESDRSSRELQLTV